MTDADLIALKLRLKTAEEENLFLRAEAKGAEKLFLALSEKYAHLRHQGALDEIDREVTLRALQQAMADRVELRKGREE